MFSPLASNNTLALLLSTVLLAACGGGSSEQPASSTTPPANDTTASSPFASCFIWTPGVRYVKDDGYKTQMIQEQFEGQTAITDMELTPNDVRLVGAYITVDAGYVNVLGVNQYDVNGLLKRKDVYTNFRLPTNMTVGQTIVVNYTMKSMPIDSAPTTTAESTSYKFEALETLTLGGKTFTDVCQLRTPTEPAGTTRVLWVAKGFGVIKQEERDAKDAIVEYSLQQLVTIEAAP